MTQKEAKACAWEAWIASARESIGPGVRDDVQGVLFDRWWKVHQRTLPGFRR